MAGFPTIGSLIRAAIAQHPRTDMDVPAHLDNGRLDIRLSACREHFPAAVLAPGELGGVPIDPEELPALLRALNRLQDALGVRRPWQLRFTAECAIRVAEDRRVFGIRRNTSLLLGWPMLFVLDADELRAAMAMALDGQPVTLDPQRPPLAGPRVIDCIGPELLRRCLTRVLVASWCWRELWWPELATSAKLHAEPPADALVLLRALLEVQGRRESRSVVERLGSVAPELMPPGLTGLAALGGPQIEGGSNRNAARALLWEALCERVTVALGAAFAQHLQPAWGALHLHWQTLRAEARGLHQAMRVGELDVAGEVRLAGLVEQFSGVRAAYALYRASFVRSRDPLAAVECARTLAMIDPPRGRALLSRIAGSGSLHAASAQRWLETLDAAPPATANAVVHTPGP